MRQYLRRSLLPISLIAGLLLFAGSGRAASPETSTDGQTVVVEAHQGRVVSLERPVTAVFVADPAIADVQAQSPTLLYLFGKRAGATSVFAVDGDNKVVFRRTVVVQHDMPRLRAALAAAAPGAAVGVDSIDGGLVLRGEVESPATAENLRALTTTFLGDKETLVNRLAVLAPTQVSLRVRVAEVSREVTKLLGVNWQALLSPGDFIFGLATGRDFSTLVPPGFSRFADTSGPANALLGHYASGNVDVSTIIDALERENLVTVLAEPNLTTISGETASFLAGGEFPVPVGTGTGNNDIQIQFKQFGVSLAFTPTVLSADRISLRVRPEVSDLSDRGAIKVNNLVIPALTTRRAETSIELASGQSFAIGGLISNQTRNNVDKLPGLGDLPILGPLFRSTSFQRDETELVIIVTAYLVRPVAASQLATPVDGYRPANDLERLLDGRLAKGAVAPGAQSKPSPSAGRLLGAAGFVLE
jgi:pilus assembly protein CpaC